MTMFKNFETEIELAIKIRMVENKLLKLFSEGLLSGTVHTCVGQELVGVFISKYLQDQDFIVSNHRGHGHYLSRTKDYYGLFSELMSRVSGCSNGIGGSQHFYNKNYLSNGIQGGMVSIAAGIGLSNKHHTTNAISVAYIGDGTLGQGSLYEALHMSSMLEVPLLLVIENNHYSQSTSHKQNFKGSIRKRVEGFGLKYFTCSTFDLESMDASVSSAVNFVRNSGVPAAIEVDTYRLNAHSKGDDNRSELEINNKTKSDLINIFQKLNPILFNEISDNFSSEMDSIIESVSKENINGNASGRNERLKYKESKLSKLVVDNNNLRVNQIIYNALVEIFSKNKKCFMIGEDIQNNTPYTDKPYGGAFKVTQDLSDLFPGRVLNSSISESAITGMGTGLAINGNLAIVEIMFGDFMTLIIDQLQQHACKFYEMYGRKFNVPLIVRTPMGGRRGYGPTHSQSIEALLNNIIGLDILALNNRISPGFIYKILSENIVNPTVVIENKVLYTERLNDKDITGYDILSSDDMYPVILFQPIGKIPNITVFCYGGILPEVEEVIVDIYQKYEVILEVVCPTQIKPVNPSLVIESVRITNKLVIIEEGSSVGGMGSELLSLVSEHVEKLQVKRISNEKLIPCSISAEMNILPTADLIISEIMEFYRE